MRRRLIAAALLALLAGAIVGCGGEQDGEGVVIPPESLVPSKPDYISQADGLCAFYESRVEQLGRQQFGLTARDFKVLPSGRIVFRAGRRPSNAAVEEFVQGTAIPNLRRQLEEVRALTPPRGHEERVASIFDAAERAVDRLEADPQTFADDAAVRRLFAPARAAGRRYGLKECGL